MDGIKGENELLRLYLACHENSKFWKFYYTFGDKCDFAVFISDKKSKSFIASVKNGYQTLMISHGLDWFSISSNCHNNYVKYVTLNSTYHAYKPHLCRKLDEECVTTNNICKSKWLKDVTKLRADLYGYYDDADAQMLVMSLRQRTITSLFQKID